jgi:hypothetical protein
MQQAKTLLLSLLFFIGFSILGIAVGFGIGSIGVALNNEGLFTSWKQLDGSQKIEHIVDISFQRIWAQTSDDKLYSLKFYCNRDPDCNRWIEARDIPENTNFAYELPVKKSDLCRIPSFQFFREVPGNPIECAQIEFYGMENQTNASFALLDDGKIWSWKFTSSMIVDLLVPLRFSLGGLILGITFFIIFMIQLKKKAEFQVIVGSPSKKEIS